MVLRGRTTSTWFFGPVSKLRIGAAGALALCYTPAPIMSLRAFLRVPAILFVTLFAHGTIVFASLLQPLAPRLRRRLRNAAFRRWGRQMCRILGARVAVEGRPPTGRFILVANHVSYVDIMVLATAVDGTFVAKADLRGWPLLGWIFRTADTIFIDRARKKDLLRVLEQVETCLDRDLGVMIFPEGTSGKGDEILRFKPSLLELAASEEVPVHYAVLRYQVPPAWLTHQTVCWWGDAPFLPHFFKLLDLPRFDASLRFGSEPIRAADRKALAERLRAAMMQHFTPMT